jgi:hypothetical protein
VTAVPLAHPHSVAERRQRAHVSGQFSGANVRRAPTIMMPSSNLFVPNVAGQYYDLDGTHGCRPADDELCGSALEAASALQAFSEATSAEATDALMCHVLQACHSSATRMPKATLPPRRVP